MPMRRALFLAALVFSGSCGGAPTAPSPQPAGTADLAVGAYALTLGDTPVFTCENGVCRSVMLCIGPSSALPPSATILVTVQRDGARATIAPEAAGESLRITLDVRDNSLAGTMSGTATTTSGASATASGTVAASMTAWPDLPRGPHGTTAVGMLQGELSIGGTSCSTPNHNWSLSPR